MRRVWPMAVVLALGVAAPLSAQFSLTSLSARTPTTTSAVQSQAGVGVTQMLPRLNPSSALINAPNSRIFNFSRMLPNFSFTNNRWPIQTGRSQIPAQYFGPFGQRKK